MVTLKVLQHLKLRKDSESKIHVRINTVLDLNGKFLGGLLLFGHIFENCGFFCYMKKWDVYPAIHKDIFVISARLGPLLLASVVRCCPQVQVIKHRPRQIQKAYPGLLEPGCSYNTAASASNRTNFNITPMYKAGVNLCFFLLAVISVSLKHTHW